jgi:phosphoglycolate phosphatase
VVFDLDGTLVDSRQDLAESVNELLVECGGMPHPHDVVGRMVGDGAAMLVARAFEAAGVERPPDALARFLAIYDARLVRFTRPYAGIPETLQALSARATLAVLTNKPLGATRQILEAFDLARLFDRGGIVGGDGPFPRKPDPAGLLHLARAAGVTLAETMLVGDSVIDWRTARAAGATACVARYGFGFEGFPIGELDARDVVISTPADLLDHPSWAGA